jgi:hypothetical protein
MREGYRHWFVAAWSYAGSWAPRSLTRVAWVTWCCAALMVDGGPWGARAPVSGTGCNSGGSFGIYAEHLR